MKKAHETKEIEKIERIYNFAEWCFRQKEQKLWNAAGVGFYEHLGDSTETFLEFTNWIGRDIYNDIRDLLQLRLQKEKLNKLDRHYNWEEKK